MGLGGGKKGDRFSEEMVKMVQEANAKIGKFY